MAEEAKTDSPMTASEELEQAAGVLSGRGMAKGFTWKLNNKVKRFELREFTLNEKMDLRDFVKRKKFEYPARPEITMFYMGAEAEHFALLSFAFALAETTDTFKDYTPDQIADMLRVDRDKALAIEAYFICHHGALLKELNDSGYVFRLAASLTCMSFDGSPESEERLERALKNLRDSTRERLETEPAPEAVGEAPTEEEDAPPS